MSSRGKLNAKSRSALHFDLTEQINLLENVQKLKIKRT